MHQCIEKTHALSIEAGFGLVEQQDAGTMQNGTGDGEAFLLTVGQAADTLAGTLFHADSLQGISNVLLEILQAEHPAIEAQVFGAGHVFVEHVSMGHQANATGCGCCVRANVTLGYADGTTIGASLSGEHFEEGGLARAVGAEKSDTFTPTNAETQVPQDGLAAVSLTQAMDVEGSVFFRPRDGPGGGRRGGGLGLMFNLSVYQPHRYQHTKFSRDDSEVVKDFASLFLFLEVCFICQRTGVVYLAV